MHLTMLNIDYSKKSSGNISIILNHMNKDHSKTNSVAKEEFLTKKINKFMNMIKEYIQRERKMVYVKKYNHFFYTYLGWKV